MDENRKSSFWTSWYRRDETVITITYQTSVWKTPNADYFQFQTTFNFDFSLNRKKNTEFYEYRKWIRSNSDSSCSKKSSPTHKYRASESYVRRVSVNDRAENRITTKDIVPAFPFCIISYVCLCLRCCCTKPRPRLTLCIFFSVYFIARALTHVSFPSRCAPFPSTCHMYTVLCVLHSAHFFRSINTYIQTHDCILYLW